jgi:lipid-A-disaccharide synthase
VQERYNNILYPIGIIMKLLVSAVEPSANLHLKDILNHLEYDELVGIFDESLGEPLYSSTEFAVMGIVDAIKKYFKAKEAIKELAFMAHDVDRVLLIDAPSFNLPLAKEIKKRHPHVEIIYYILPKVWIWKKYRAKLVEQYVDQAISIFPFEKHYYPYAHYFGNPLIKQISHYKEQTTENDTVAYLAGSRKSEITRLIDTYKEVAKQLSSSRNVLVIPPHLSQEQIDSYYGDISMFEVSRDTHQSLYDASFAYVCSGTATLEAALIGTPFVLVYQARAFDYWLVHLIAGNIKQVGLANIIFDYEGLGLFHQEILQEEYTVERLLQEQSKYNAKEFLEKSRRLRSILEGEGSRAIADLIARS